MPLFGGKGPLDPTDKFTIHQLFYIFIMQGIGGCVISGGINFAIAHGMYSHNSDPIWLFQLPTTLLGDAGVTTILQCIITWLITVMLANNDLKTGGVAPIGFFKEPSNSRLRWFLFLDQDEEAGDKGDRVGWGATVLSFLSFLVGQILRGFMFSIAFFAIMVGPTVGILLSKGTQSGGDWVYETTWVPQIFKGLYGGILGLFLSPIYVLFWATRAGWAIQKGETWYGERWRKPRQGTSLRSTTTETV